MPARVPSSTTDASQPSFCDTTTLMGSATDAVTKKTTARRRPRAKPVRKKSDHIERQHTHLPKFRRTHDELWPCRAFRHEPIRMPVKVQRKARYARDTHNSRLDNSMLPELLQPRPHSPRCPDQALCLRLRRIAGGRPHAARFPRIFRDNLLRWQ